nr:plasmid partitioning protein RepB [Nitrosomonas nitrosa]
MARKGLLSSIIDDEFTAVNSESSALRPDRPASKSAFGMMSRAAEQMASRIDAAEELERRLLAGQSIIEVDPDLIDDSFVDDRMEESRENIQDLIDSFRERGQDSPILIRPHRHASGRFETIFGHRRKRAAKATGKNVRAVIRELSDREHVIAQGQENAARADLSFIERAMFAQTLAERDFDNQTIMTALGVNKTVLSKMQAVTTQIAPALIRAIGPARNVGRDRWYELSVCLRDTARHDVAVAIAEHQDFAAADSDERFELLYTQLANSPSHHSSAPQTHGPGANWEPGDCSLRVTTKSRKNSVTIALQRPDGIRFGNWISQNLDTLYVEFRRVDSTKETGD